MKKAIIATLLSSAVAAPAFATSDKELEDANLVFNTDDSQAMELAALSSAEMKDTKGAVFPLLGFGASMVGHFGARSLASYYVTRTGTIAGTVGLAEYFGGR